MSEHDEPVLLHVPCEHCSEEAGRAVQDDGLDVERLARALNDTDHADCLGWDNPKAGCRGYYRRAARAAIEAYRTASPLNASGDHE